MDAISPSYTAVEEHLADPARGTATKARIPPKTVGIPGPSARPSNIGPQSSIEWRPLTAWDSSPPRARMKQKLFLYGRGKTDSRRHRSFAHSLHQGSHVSISSSPSYQTSTPTGSASEEAEASRRALRLCEVYGEQVVYVKGRGRTKTEEICR